MVKVTKVTLPFFLETITATVTKFGTMSLFDKALHNICSTLTFTQGQGQKKYGQNSQKVTLPFFSETIKATVTKFGTMVVRGMAFQYTLYDDPRSRSY